MELVSRNVSTVTSRIIPKFPEAILLPIGDIQYGVEACDLDRLKRHLEWADKKPNAYFLGMGDYVDFGSPSNRGKLRGMLANNELYDVVGDGLKDLAERHLEDLKKVLAPTKGKWLGLLSGHHFWEFDDGTTSDTRLADFLEAPFLGSSAIVRMDFPATNSYTNIFCHHGEGSGALQSAPLNRLEKYMNAWEDVQIFLIAHHHKKVSAKLPRVRPVFDGEVPGLKEQQCILAGTGSFLKGYVPGSTDRGRAAGTYVEKKMLRPVTLGAVTIWLRPYVNDVGDGAVDLDITL